MKKKMIRVEIQNDLMSIVQSERRSLDDFVQLFNSAIEKIKNTEYKNIEIGYFNCIDDYESREEYMDFIVTGEREETDKEFQKRTNTEKRKREERSKIKQTKEQEEKQLYEKLKKKFEKNP